MFDPLQIQDDIISLIREVPFFQNLTEEQRAKNIREYDDEFKTQQESWKFAFPCALVRVIKAIPRFKYVDASSDVYDYDIIVFIAHDSKDNAKTHCANIAKQIHDYVNGEELEITEGEGPTLEKASFKIQCGEFDFFDKVNAVMIYTLEIGTTPL